MQSSENAYFDFIRCCCWERKGYSSELELICTSSLGPCERSHLCLSVSVAVRKLAMQSPVILLWIFSFFFLSADKGEKKHRNMGVRIHLIVFLGTSVRFFKAVCLFLKWVTFTFDKTFRADKKAACLLKQTEIFPCHQTLSRAAKRQVYTCKG